MGAPVKSTGFEALSLKRLSHTLICRPTTGSAPWSSGVTESGRERAEDSSKKGAPGKVCACQCSRGF